MGFHEVNFDGLPGPAHNFAGLAGGNIASEKHGLSQSNPRRAALQGLAKMRLLMEQGLKQAIIPPHERPHTEFLGALGFATNSRANLENTLEKLHRENFRLLAAAYSSSAMWTANSAVITPSPDSSDGRVHFTPANLSANPHRSLEAEQTTVYYRRVFADESRFAVHHPLPAALPDEGAANFSRICAEHGKPGLGLFVHGRSVLEKRVERAGYLPRQSREAFESIIRRHGIRRALLFAQDPGAVQAGVFHNDVIATGDRDLFLHHEKAFADPNAISTLREQALRGTQTELLAMRIDEDELSLSESVESYLFNSQIVQLPEGGALLLAPGECESHPRARKVLERIQEESGRISSLRFADLSESMKNGGGPACLRIRIVLSDEELTHVHGGIILNETLLEKLESWVNKHYREKLSWQDLRDPALIMESRTALDEITSLLDLGNSYYPFQRD